MFPGPESGDNTSLEHALSHIKYYLQITNNTSVRISNKTQKQWNSELETLLKDKKFRNIIQRLINIDNTEVALKNLLVLNLVRNFCKQLMK